MLWVLLVGCGGGLRDGKLLRDLDKDEAKELCSEYSEKKTAECTRKGYCRMITVGGPECDISGGGDAVLPSCQATVADYRSCMDKVYAEPCLKMTGLPTDCNWQRDCIVSDSDDTGGPSDTGEPCED